MAEFLYAFAVEEILKKLGLVAADGISRARRLRGDLERFRDSTTRIQYLLQDAADKQSTDARVKPWLVKLQDVAYEADDVLDEFAYWTLKKQVEGKGILTLGYLPLLQTLFIEDCPKLTALQGLKFCTSLQELCLSVCNGLVSIEADSEEFHGLTTLRELILRHCENLESIPNGQYLTSLKTLDIYTCPKITTLQGLKFCTSLWELRLINCNGLVSIAADSEEFYGLTSLQQLKLFNCENLTSIPSVQSLTSLKELDIYECLKLTVLPAGLKYCTSLQQLSISNCKGLISIPEDSRELPSSLVSLHITYCRSLSYIPNDMLCNLTHLKELDMGPFSDELEEFPALNSIQNLNLASLEELIIHGWDKLKSLPHQLQHFTSLKRLYISFFYGPEALPEWFSNLSSLQFLQILRCKNLKYLPTSMQHLSNLKTLNITGCPLLRERCARGSGLEWPNISHIQEIRIYDETI